MIEPLDAFLELARIVSPPGAERPVADRVLAFAHERGLMVSEDDTARRLGGSAGNLHIRLPATQSEGIPVFFCGHLDTIPVDGPIHPRVTDGRVCSDGRTILGADNKASVAAMLAATDHLLETGREHAGVDLVFTTMEEVGCRGAKAFDARAVEGRCGFVFDHAGPIGTYVGEAPAGSLVELDFRGRAAHAGIAPEAGRSAIQAASRFVAGLELGRHADGATVNVGVIHGGTAHNVIAAECRLTVDVRARTHRRRAELVQRILTGASDASARCDCEVGSTVEDKYRDYRFGDDEPVVRLGRRALEAAGLHAEPLVGGGGSDASVFNENGIPCLNLGSGMESIHTCDESIAVADLRRMVDVILAIVDEAARSIDSAPAPS